MRCNLFQGVIVDPKLSIGGKPVEGLPVNQIPAGMAGAIVSGKGALLEFVVGEDRTPSRFVGTGVMKYGLGTTETIGILFIDGKIGPMLVKCTFTVCQDGVYMQAKETYDR